MVFQIPACHVWIDDGVIHLRHQVSGEEATAVTVEQARIQGVILRVAHAWGCAA